MGVRDANSDTIPEPLRRLFLQFDDASTPVTTAEAADTLECGRSTARELLNGLVAETELETRQLDGGTRVWWRGGDRPRAEETRADSTEFNTFIKAVENYAIFRLDPDGTVASWNDGAERIKGYTEDEIVGEHFSVFYTDDTVEGGVPQQNLKTAVENGRAEDRGWRVRRDGSTFWAHVTITAVRNEDGSLQGFTKVTRDLTEQREYERRIQRERDQTEQLLRTAPIAIAVQNVDGETVLANRRAQEALGLSERDIIEGPADSDEWQLYDSNGDPLAPTETPSARVLETGEPVLDEEINIVSPDGDRMVFTLNAAPVRDSTGAIERVITAGEDVTELKQHERELEQRKAELETELSEILGRISDAFYALDDEWRFTHLNERAAEIFRRQADELIGRSITELYPQIAEGEVWDHFETAMETQETVDFEWYVEELDSWLEFTIYPSETGLSVYFRDVTDRKTHEEELAKYETIIETINDAIYVVDDDLRFTMVNDAYTELTGYTREEILGEHASLVISDETIEQGRQVREQLAAGAVSNPTLETTIETASGDTVPVEASFAALPTAGDEPKRIGVVRDITERKERERALQESERRYRTLVENFPNGAVGLFDEDLRYTAVGGELMSEIGVTAADRVGVKIHEIYPDDLLATVEPYFHDALAGEASSFEAQYHGRDLLAYTLPIRNADDEVYAGMLVVQDVTELKETQRQLEASNERLEQFAYAASHDLQEPLRMVTSYLQLLERRYGDDIDEEGEEFIEFAVDGAERMHEMIEALLGYSRVETRGDPFEPVALDSVLDSVRDDLQVKIEESEAEISAESLPRVAGDESQLRQVFQNLLDNAIEYSGEGPPRIDVHAERAGEEWTISVRDNGIGIGPEHTDQVFQVFQRLHSQADHEGTGIGLALCKRIVERHGGEIWVDSEPDEDTTFAFTLPAADGE